jgi:hypothetical protein
VNNAAVKILTPNHHTAYLCLLAKTGHEFDVIGHWDSDNRPLPLNVKLIDRRTAFHELDAHDVIIGHNLIKDFRLLLRALCILKKPCIQVIHGSNSGLGETKGTTRRAAKRIAKSLLLRGLVSSLRLRGVEVVFISEYNRQTWAMSGTVIDHGIPVDEMNEYSGDDETLLTVGNALHREYFELPAILKVRDAVPLRIIGVNPGIAGARPSRDWDELKTAYSRCRAYLNFTREPERGYTLCTLEAMATGMPVVTLRHRVSPIVDGWNGFVVDDAETMAARAKLLLADRELARRLGQNARRTIVERYGIDRFVAGWNEVLTTAVSGARAVISESR